MDTIRPFCSLAIHAADQHACCTAAELNRGKYCCRHRSKRYGREKDCLDNAQRLAKNSFLFWFPSCSSGHEQAQFITLSMISWTQLSAAMTSRHIGTHTSPCTRSVPGAAAWSMRPHPAACISCIDSECMACHGRYPLLADRKRSCLVPWFTRTWQPAACVVLPDPCMADGLTGNMVSAAALDWVWNEEWRKIWQMVPKCQGQKKRGCLTWRIVTTSLGM